MKDIINKTIKYYSFKSKEIVDYINKSKDLTADEIIQSGKELQTLEHKITALEVAKEN